MGSVTAPGAGGVAVARVFAPWRPLSCSPAPCPPAAAATRRMPDPTRESGPRGRPRFGDRRARHRGAVEGPERRSVTYCRGYVVDGFLGDYPREDFVRSLDAFTAGARGGRPATSICSPQPGSPAATASGPRAPRADLLSHRRRRGGRGHGARRLRLRGERREGCATAGQPQRPVHAGPGRGHLVDLRVRRGPRRRRTGELMTGNGAAARRSGARPSSRARPASWRRDCTAGRSAASVSLVKVETAHDRRLRVGRRLAAAARLRCAHGHRDPRWELGRDPARGSGLRHRVRRGLRGAARLVGRARGTWHGPHQRRSAGGRPELMAGAVEELFGVAPDYVVTLGTAGLGQARRLCGGHRGRQRRETSAVPPWGLDIHKGRNRIDGGEAIGFARARYKLPRATSTGPRTTRR